MVIHLNGMLSGIIDCEWLRYDVVNSAAAADQRRLLTDRRRPCGRPGQELRAAWTSRHRQVADDHESDRGIACQRQDRPVRGGEDGGSQRRAESSGADWAGPFLSRASLQQKHETGCSRTVSPHIGDCADCLARGLAEAGRAAEAGAGGAERVCCCIASKIWLRRFLV